MPREQEKPITDVDWATAIPLQNFILKVVFLKILLRLSLKQNYLAIIQHTGNSEGGERGAKPPSKEEWVSPLELSPRASLVDPASPSNSLPIPQLPLSRPEPTGEVFGNRMLTDDGWSWTWKLHPASPSAQNPILVPRARLENEEKYNLSPKSVFCLSFSPPRSH